MMLNLDVQIDRGIFPSILTSVYAYGLVDGFLWELFLSKSIRFIRTRENQGMVPGGEFRRAYQECQRVEGCLISFGDRSIRITLLRAFRTISFWQKLHLIFLNFIERPISAGKKLEEIATDVLFRERNQIMAYTTQYVVADAANEALNNPLDAQPPIVVIVGMRHVRGVQDFIRGGVILSDLEEIQG